MSNSDSNKKEPSKKPTNSYALLLKGLSESKPKTSNSQKRSNKDKEPELDMGSNNENSENPSTSDAQAGDGEIQDPDIPDRSYGDLFCKLCDSHMNSDNMWEAHITGKRHIKNVKKGDTDSKYEDLPDEESTIKYELRNVKDPIVGLSYIHEIRRKEPNVPPIYNCFLCHASIATVPLVTEHVITLKHRLNYIKENNSEEYELLEATNLKKGHLEPLALDIARKMEEQFGRGTVKVKQEKKKTQPAYTYSAKKSFNFDDDSNGYQKSYKNSRDDNVSLWKSVDSEKSFRQFERSRSPLKSVRDFEDSARRHSRSRSPRDLKERKRNYSGDDYSMDGYRRSFSSRNLSPPQDYYEKHRSFSKRDISPVRSFSKRDISPVRSFSKRDISPVRSFSKRDISPVRSFSKRDASPKHDYPSFRSTDSYSHSLRSVSRDRMDYVSPRLSNINPRESVKEPFDSYGRQKSLSCLPQETHLPSRERFIENPRPQKSKETVLEDLLLFSAEDIYEIFYLRLKSLPEVSSINEMIAVSKAIGEAQKKLNCKIAEELIATLKKMQKGETSSNTIPGLGGAMSSKTQSSVPTTADFLNNIFKQNTAQSKPSVSYTMSASYASVINSEQTTDAYQAPPQVPSASYHQTPSNTSYLNQTQYHAPSTNVPYPTGSIQNFQPNIQNLGASHKIPTQSQMYNYSQYSSASNPSDPKNFYRKY